MTASTDIATQGRNSPEDPRIPQRSRCGIESKALRGAFASSLPRFPLSPLHVLSLPSPPMLKDCGLEARRI
jgi:hypothetical protein